MVTAEPELTGALLEGRYRVGELLAVGGMSRVYRGTDTRLDRAVAVKVMDPRLAADPAFRNRFEREARAIAKIDHPGVIGVYDQGEHGGPPEPVVYLVMELVDGGTLRDVLGQHGALELPEVFAVMEPVLAALASAHAQGMAHRDVKPENVLISASGAVKVADFGLVTAAAQARASTAGMIIGTVAYLSPEQVTGRGIDARSDVYAAGILFYELITGNPPYDGDSALSIAYRHVNEDVPPPSDLVPDLPPSVDALVLGATRREQDARPPDAETFLHAVRSVRVSLGIPRVDVPVPGADRRTVPLARDPLGEAPGAPAPRATRALTHMHSAPDAPSVGDDWDTSAAATEHIRRRRRSRRVLAAWIVGVVLLGILVAALSWGAGVGRWTTAPVVVGMDEQTATRVVREAGLVPKFQERHHDTIPSGRIADSTPVAGTQVTKGSTETLTLSSGRPRVPTITPGTSVEQAQQMLRSADLTPAEGKSTRKSHPTAPVGTVIGTSPAAGTEATIGSPVSLVLSSGPPPRRSRDYDSEDAGRSLADQIQRSIEDAFGG
ncbi:Stk1 family PASTA domain-containing Ser/Thr kinase [Pseudonocardia spinosispora]|uniref:Stk1 family PASTA domain-containing Ser/Thr kinase n=1 Tax=Pseudonocardia spinosispora TaxID=103441 RepID=UPI0004231EAC|nr:Stk1 family PASTA domain-containing Ser/Thr kinase [Pseudonocardia spinosispora]